jgi:hypothetical protein
LICRQKVEILEGEGIVNINEYPISEEMHKEYPGDSFVIDPNGRIDIAGKFIAQPQEFHLDTRDLNKEKIKTGLMKKAERADGQFLDRSSILESPKIDTQAAEIKAAEIAVSKDKEKEKIGEIEKEIESVAMPESEIKRVDYLVENQNSVTQESIESQKVTSAQNESKKFNGAVQIIVKLANVVKETYSSPAKTASAMELVLQREQARKELALHLGRG